MAERTIGARIRDAVAAFMRTGSDESFFGGGLWSSPSVTGISVNQQTAMQATVVMACASVLSEDVSKMWPELFRRVDMFGHKLGGRELVTDHPVANIFHRPNDWQTWPEFCRQMVIFYLLRGNAHAVIIRDGRGDPIMFVPINPDRVRLWESPDGSLWWMVTRAGLHELAILRGLPLLIPYDDVFHLKDLSANGLVGQSRISLAREAIGLALAQEQQQARLMGNGARPSGVLATDKTLSKEAADRLKANWETVQSGLLNSGKTAILENGLKWQAISLSFADMEFLASRQFQAIEICRMFRVPPHMIGDLSRGTFNNIVQQSQEYRNNTLTSHTDVWEKRLDWQFGLRAKNLVVDFNESALLKADITARYGVYRIGKLSGLDTTNEIRMAEGKNPVADGDKLYQPLNMGELGSDMSGAAAKGGNGDKGGSTDPGTGPEDQGGDNTV